MIGRQEVDLHMVVDEALDGGPSRGDAECVPDLFRYDHFALLTNHMGTPVAHGR